MAYTRQQGWKLHTASDDLAVDYYQTLRGEKVPLDRLIFAKRQDAVAPTDIVAKKYHSKLFPGQPFVDTPRIQNITSVIQGHEVSELYALNIAKRKKRFGSHASIRVIRDELALAERMGTETLGDILTVRRLEQQKIFDRAAGKTPWREGVLPKQQRHAVRYARKMDEILSSGEARWRKLTRPLNSIPGRDDAYNTIEGLRHGGMAGELRRQNTDFGSGFIGKLFGSMEKFVAASPSKTRKILDKIKTKPVRKYPYYKEELGSAFNISNVTKSFFGRIKYKSDIHFDSKEMRKVLKESIGDKYSASTIEDLLRIVKHHEGSEGFHSIRYYKKQVKKYKITDPEEIPSLDKFGPHANPGIITDEILMAMKLGPETYQAYKTFRQNELQVIRKSLYHSETSSIAEIKRLRESARGRYIAGQEVSMGELKRELKEFAEYPGVVKEILKQTRRERSIFLETGESEYFKKGLLESHKTIFSSFYDYINRTEKMFSRAEKVWAPKLGISLPIENNAFNTINGMPHGGMAEVGRKTNTPFGSKYDRMRAIARMLGVSFENLTKRKSFRQALQEATFVREFDPGAFGKVGLYKAKYRGEEFQFVKKEITEEARALVDVAADPERWRAGLDIRHEAKFLKKLGAETHSVPSLYGIIDDKLYMEYMPGEVIGEWSRKNIHQTISPQAKAHLLEDLETMAEKKIMQSDIHSGNIMYDPASGRASLIDFGVAKANIPRGEALQTMRDEVLALPGISFERAALPSPSAIREQQLAMLRQQSASPRQSVSSSPVNPYGITPLDNRRASNSLTQMSLAFKDTQRQIWESSRSGGRGHLRYTSQSRTK